MRAPLFGPTAVLLASVTMAFAQLPSAVPGTIYRVFLATGEPLPSYGEPLVTGDRVIFNLLVAGRDEPAEMQLVSLPVDGVDRERTERYTLAMRAAHYRATRGEADYAALTAEVARVLDQLATLSDPSTRLRLAEGARGQILEWAEMHYQYRAADIGDLASLFDDVIRELRIAAGAPPIELALIARPTRGEPLLRAPTLRESVALSISAAEAADIGAERIGILTHAARAAERMGDPVVRQTIAGALEQEVQAGSAYAALLSALRVRADAARAEADRTTLTRLVAELERRDEGLGQRRPAEVRALGVRLDRALDEVRAFEAALEAHEEQLTERRAYARRLRPLLDRFDRLEASLVALREMDGIAPSRLDIADAELLRLQSVLDRTTTPDALIGTGAMFENAIRFAREAFARRREARSSRSLEMREASAAAAGALLLASRVRVDFEASLEPPVIR